MKPSADGGRPPWLTVTHLLVLTFAAVAILPAGAVWAAAGGHGEAHGTQGWVATDTYRVMNFIVLAAALFFFLRKPIAQALRGRIQGIQDQLDDLEVKKKQAEAELAEYNEKLAQLEKEADRIVADYITQGKEAKARILKEAEAAAQKIEDQAMRNIAHEFEQAREKLQTEVLEKALIKAESLIQRNVTDDDQDRLVDEYISKVVTR